MTTLLQKPPRKPKKGFDPDFRFTVVQYQKMIAQGIIAPGARIELLDGKVVNKMARNPAHDTSLTLAQHELSPLVMPEWYLRIQMAIVAGAHSQPEPDIAVVFAPASRYAKQHPGAKDVDMLVEVADSTLLDDRRDRAPIYAGGRIPWYWIVNVAEKIVEVYTDPKGGAAPEYRKRLDYGLDTKVPVILTGKTLGHIEVSKLFPAEAEK
ncbi:MAG: Uma2 family endonuclease [Planctomycetes bacterium]|nr:Uma2 family endonuclease [Planctomycetota bacterium]